MSTKDKKELTHIQVKDNGLNLSSELGNELKDVSSMLEVTISKNLVKGSKEDLTRWRIRQNNKIRAFKKESKQTIREYSKNITERLKTDDKVNLKPSQAAMITKQIDKGLLFLQNDAINTYQKIVDKTIRTIRSQKALDLQEALTKHISSDLNIGVVYKDGKHYKFDTYWEMKARTEIQEDIAKNMVDTGNANGVVFYLCSYFGDSAKDHADYQGKIYYDKDWETSAPKERIDEIRNYIDSNKLMSVQEVMGEPVYLSTRPNCRHYFQYIDIDSVLGSKSVDRLREARGLNFNGKYKPEKYKALQQQRLNERNIRAEKLEIAKNEQLLALNVGDKQLQQAILKGEARVRNIQANQRELIKNNSNLERQYNRESNGLRVTLGVNEK